SALAWSLENDGKEMLHATQGLYQFWLIHSHFVEGRKWLEQLLAHPKLNSVTVDRAQALRQAASMALSQGDYVAALEYLNDSLDLAEKLKDARSVAYAKAVLGVVAFRQHEFVHAGDLWQEALLLFRGLDDELPVATTLMHLGLLARRQSDYS